MGKSKDWRVMTIALSFRSYLSCFASANAYYQGFQAWCEIGRVKKISFSLQKSFPDKKRQADVRRYQKMSDDVRSWGIRCTEQNSSACLKCCDPWMFETSGWIRVAWTNTAKRKKWLRRSETARSDCWVWKYENDRWYKLTAFELTALLALSQRYYLLAASQHQAEWKKVCF